MKRNLASYIYIGDLSNISPYLDINSKYLNLYSHIFTGKKILYISSDTEINEDLREVIKYNYSSLNPDEIIYVKNDPESRESAYFLEMMNRIHSSAEEGSMTFYCHNKGSTYLDNHNVVKWASAMYFFNLNNVVKAESEFSNGKLSAGIFRVDHPCPPWVESNWHFSGTFFWMNWDIFNQLYWDKHYSDRFSTESYLGYKTPLSSSYNIENINNHGCDLRYDHYWNNFFTKEIVGSQYDEFILSLKSDTNQIEFFKEISKYPSAWVGHFNFAIESVKSLKPKTIVELGVDYGFSSFSFAYPKIGKVYGIDCFCGDQHTGKRNTMSIVKEFNENLKKDFGVEIEIVKGDFNKVSETWDREIDILHIDGLHTYDAVKNDFETWSKFLSPNGVVMFHDVDEFEGVKKFFKEIPGYKFVRSGSCGLGVWSREYQPYSILSSLN